MGLFFKSDPVSDAEKSVRYAEDYVKQCQRTLEIMKERKAASKKSGNYRGSGYTKGSKHGGVEDANIWAAEDNLKLAKERLAAAKKNLTAARKK